MKKTITGVKRLKYFVPSQKCLINLRVVSCAFTKNLKLLIANLYCRLFSWCVIVLTGKRPCR